MVPGAIGPWRRHILLLVGAGAVLMALFGSDAADIAATWGRTGAFHHCYLIPVILAWLVWQRRSALAAVRPHLSLVGVAVAAPGAIAWLLGAAAYVELFRQAGLVVMAIGAAIAIIGLPAARILRFPLAFALFFIPAGSEFEPWLQVVTAHVSVVLLHAVGIAATLEGVFVQTPAGLFRIAEECSGTAFLLAMATYAALVCAMCFTSVRRRVIFVAVAMPVAVIANGVRAFAVMLLANMTSIDNPAVQDHALYGWLLFAIVLAALMLGFAPWFDRPADAPTVDVPMPPAPVTKLGSAAIVLPALLALVVLPRLWLLSTDPADAPATMPPTAPAIPGWTIVGDGEATNWHPHFMGASAIRQWRFTGPGGVAADVAIVLFDRQADGRELVGFGQGAVAPDGPWAVMANDAAPAGGRGEWLRRPVAPPRYVATWYVIGGRVTGSRLTAKLTGVAARLGAGTTGAAAILLSSDDPAAERTVAAVLRAAGSVEVIADRTGAMR